MAKTVNEGLADISAELKETNKRYSQSVKAAAQLLPVSKTNSAVLKSVGGAVKDNLVASTAGFASFIDQLEALPVFGAVSKLTKSLGGKLFSAARQKREDRLLAKQLNISAQEVKTRRVEQELLEAEAAKNEKLLDAAKALGYSAEQFEAMTNAAAQGEMTAADVEKAREERRANEKLVAAVEGVGDDISNLDGDGDKENKNIFSGILDSVKGFIPAIGAALTTLGTTLMGGLVALGTKIVLALKGGLGGLGKLMNKIPGGKALGSIASKAGGGLARAGGGLLRGAASAAKFAGPIGLAVTAGMGIFDGLSAGIEEYKKSGSIGKAVKEGFAGAVSGLTFGILDQETISNGMTAIGDFAKKGWDGFTNLASGAMEGLSNLGSSVGGWFSSWWSDEEEGIKEENEKSGGILDSVTGGMKAAADSYANLYGSAFDALGSGVESLTGIEMPSFDDVKEKVGSFANNMKDSIAKGWESVTETASNAWSGVKSFFGFGGDKEEPESVYPSGIQLGYTPTSTEQVYFKFGPNGEYLVEPDQNKAAQEYTGQVMAEPLEGDTTAATTGIASNIAQIADQVKEETASIFGAVKSFFGFGGDATSQQDPELEKLKDQKMLNDMEMEEISQRMDKFEAGKNAYIGRDTQAKYDIDQARFNELLAEQNKIDQQIATSFPTGIQLGYTPNSVGRVYFKFGPNGEYLVEPDQNKAAQEYTGIAPQGSGNGQRLETANTTASDISREYMKNGGGNTTVVNAPNNSTTVAGGGGGGATPIPVGMRDNSSASQAANSNF